MSVGITPDDVRRLLKGCGAPEPWNDGLINSEASGLRFSQESRRDKDVPWKIKERKARVGFERAMKARLSKLRGARSLFEQHLEDEKKYSGKTWPFQGHIEKLTAEILEIEGILFSLEKLVLPKPRLHPLPWHYAAEQIIDFYWSVTDTNAVSKDGPCARFTRAVLSRLGLTVTEAAIEKFASKSSHLKIERRRTAAERLKARKDVDDHLAKILADHDDWVLAGKPDRQQAINPDK